VPLRYLANRKHGNCIFSSENRRVSSNYFASLHLDVREESSSLPNLNFRRRYTSEKIARKRQHRPCKPDHIWGGSKNRRVSSSSCASRELRRARKSSGKLRKVGSHFGNKTQNTSKILWVLFQPLSLGISNLVAVCVLTVGRGFPFVKSLFSTLFFWRCPYSVRCRIYVTVGCPSVRSSVPSIGSSNNARRVCCWGREGSR